MTAGNSPDPKHLIELANYRMPFGKYKGELLVKIPEAYFTWFKQKGFPEGKLGNMLRAMINVASRNAFILVLVF
jgi:uncharacterized protein (DUF3820 family)